MAFLSLTHSHEISKIGWAESNNTPSKENKMLKLPRSFSAFVWMLKRFKIKKLQWRDFIKDDFYSHLCAECTARNSRVRRQQRSLSSRSPAKMRDVTGVLPVFTSSECWNYPLGEPIER
jgi:hypothetical protein